MPDQRKHWAFVTTSPEGSAFAFEDQLEMIQLLCECEVEKYAERHGLDPDGPEAWERFTVMPRLFLQRCFTRGITYEELRKEFGLPQREQGVAA